MLPLHDDRPRKRFPFGTLLLILLNFFVFIGWQLRFGLDQSVEAGGLVPAEFTHGLFPDAVIHILSSMFMHAGWLHILGNMWFLWIFGVNVEGEIGPVAFCAFYLLCGAIADLAHIACSPNSLLPLVGASGAVSGVLGAYLILHPKASITTFVPILIFFKIIRLRAWFFLLVWIAFQVLAQAASAQPGGGGIAYIAHIAGFLSGMLLIFFFMKTRPSP